MSRRVLVIEDDPDFQRLLVRVLGEMKDVETSTASEGVAALISVRERRPDLAVLDLGLPRLDGYEICRVLRSSAATSGIRILAVTGRALSPDQRDFLARQADEVLPKPVELSELRAAVRRLLP